MSSKTVEHPAGAPSRSWSIARRLIFLYTLSATFILAFATILLYLGMVGGFKERRNAFLRDEINILRAMLQEDETFVHREIALEYKELQFIRHFVRVLDENGRVLAETPHMSELLPSEAFPPPTHDRYGAKAEAWTPAGQGFLLKSTWVETREGIGRILQVAMDITGGEEMMASFRRNLVIILAVGLFLFSVVGFYITRQGLRPLSKINESTKRISAANLEERIGSHHWPEELAALATSFDQMLDRLQDSFDRLSQCTSNLAHELRTPINNLMGEAEVALARERTPEEYRKIVESSLEEYSRLSRIFDSLLFLARAENGMATLARTRVDAGQELEKIREYYEALAEDTGVTISCHGKAAMEADPSLFRRAVGNLLENALKHTPADGRISLRARQTPETVEIRVEDTGCGISAEHLPRLFDRFYRIDDTRHRHPHGVGLGLAIVKSIMDLHGGSVIIQASPERGTAVILSFPRATPQSPPSTPNG